MESNSSTLTRCPTAAEERCAVAAAKQGFAHHESKFFLTRLWFIISTSLLILLIVQAPSMASAAPSTLSSDLGRRDAKVQLYVYDLSHGMASQLSQSILGTQIHGIWHTSIVLHNQEWWFGQGISFTSPPGTTNHGRPLRVVDLGYTNRTVGEIKNFFQTFQKSYR